MKSGMTQIRICGPVIAKILGIPRAVIYRRALLRGIKMYQELELCRHFEQRHECKKCNKRRNRIRHLLNQYGEEYGD